jgi:Glycosyl hydrolases family 16
MKPLRLVLTVLPSLIFCAGSIAAERQLLWADEFDKAGLPDKSKWAYESGFIRNNELQFYTRDRLENARIENWMLVIEGRKEKYPNPAFKPGIQTRNPRGNVEFASYTSASINTWGITNFLYGRIEARAKLPQGKGVWPAFWMLGANRSVGWPRCGEIDIMEFVGKEPQNVHATMHFSKDGKHASKGSKLAVDAPFNDFHVYAVEWTKDKIECFYDDKSYFTFDIDLAGTGPENPFRKPQYILINLALGGSWGGPMDDAALPQKYLIDYVRVYAPKQ